MIAIMSGLCVALLAGGTSPARGENNKGDATAELKALDAKLTNCFKTRDFQTLGKHMAEDYILIDPRGGVHTKEQYLKHLTEGTMKIPEMKETDVKVRVFGDTGVVTGLLHVKGKVEDKEVNAEYRWTRVYSKKGDNWLCVLEQHTYVLPKMEKK